MARLPDEAIEEFNEIWRKEYGEELPYEEAAVRAAEVFAVIRLALERRVTVTADDWRQGADGRAADPVALLEAARFQVSAGDPD